MLVLLFVFTQWYRTKERVPFECLWLLRGNYMTCILDVCLLFFKSTSMTTTLFCKKLCLLFEKLENSMLPSIPSFVSLAAIWGASSASFSNHNSGGELSINCIPVKETEPNPFEQKNKKLTWNESHNMNDFDYCGRHSGGMVCIVTPEQSGNFTRAGSSPACVGFLPDSPRPPLG